jgi:DUF438 domain-containing protein
MNDYERKNQLGRLVKLAMDCMGVAVTIIDTKGTLLYYNQHSAKILDRKPEYIGTDIHSHHKKADSNKKVDLMLKEFKEGRKGPFHYGGKKGPFSLRGQTLWKNHFRNPFTHYKKW